MINTTYQSLRQSKSHLLLKIVCGLLGAVGISSCAGNHLQNRKNSAMPCAVVGFTDTVNNEIKNIHLEKSSGYPKMDEAAENSVKNMNSPKRPPTAIADMNFSVQICFNFTDNQKQ